MKNHTINCCRSIRRYGFTLIEILIAIAIIVGVAAVIIPVRNAVASAEVRHERNLHSANREEINTAFDAKEAKVKADNKTELENIKAERKTALASEEARHVSKLATIEATKKASKNSKIVSNANKDAATAKQRAEAAAKAPLSTPAPAKPPVATIPVDPTF